MPHIRTHTHTHKHTNTCTQTHTHTNTCIETWKPMMTSVVHFHTIEKWESDKNGQMMLESDFGDSSSSSSCWMLWSRRVTLLEVMRVACHNSKNPLLFLSQRFDRFLAGLAQRNLIVYLLSMSGCIRKGIQGWEFYHSGEITRRKEQRKNFTSWEIVCSSDYIQASFKSTSKNLFFQITSPKHSRLIPYMPDKNV